MGAIASGSTVSYRGVDYVFDSAADAQAFAACVNSCETPDVCAAKFNCIEQIRHQGELSL
jgi:hypothetical protein